MLGHPLTRQLDIPLAELFLSRRKLIDLSSIVSYDEPSREVEIQPTSLVDFLSDKHRSNGFYIDMASTHADFVCRTLQWVKGPDGIRGTAVL